MNFFSRVLSRTSCLAEMLEKRQLLSAALFPGKMNVVNVAMHALAAADLNSDGKMDLIATGSGGVSGTVAVLLGSGDGSFSPAAEYSTTSSSAPTHVAVGDVNGDGHPDIVVAGNFGIAILFNNGDGTFGTAVALPSGSAVAAIAVADLNADGRPDLIACSGAAAGVMLQAADGTFAPAVSYPTDAGSDAVIVSDVTGDGKPDLVVANLNANDISVFKNTGAGTFLGAINYEAGVAPVAVVATDVNGDGKPDLAVANTTDAGTVTVLVNGGRGVFGPSSTYSAGSRPQTIAAADFNGDGHPDLITANYNSSNLSLLNGSASGSFGATQNFSIGGEPGEAIASDFNGDGKPDLASGDFGGVDLTVLLNSDNSVFNSGKTFPTGTSPGSVALADINADDKADLIVANISSNNLSVYPGHGDGTFGSLINYSTGSGPEQVVAADLNGDGKADLLTADYSGSAAAGDFTAILFNGSTGTMQSDISYPLYSTGAPATPISVAAGDINGDGKNDVVVADPREDDVETFLNTGNGTFTRFHGYSLNDAPSSVVLTDLNGDGKADIVCTCTNDIVVLMNTGNGFAAKVAYASSGYPYDYPQTLTAADVTGDGEMDIITGNQNNNISVFPGNGDGTFGVVSHYFSSGGAQQPGSIVSIDLNGDGKIDIATANYYEGTVSVFLNDGGGHFDSRTDYSVGGNLRAIAAMDVSGDGNADLVVANTLNNNTTVLINTGFKPVVASFASVASNTLTINAALAGEPVNVSESDNLYTVWTSAGSISFSASTFSSVVFDGAAGNAVLNTMSYLDHPLTFNCAGGADTLNVYGGAVTLAGDPASSGGSLSVSDHASFAIAAGASGGGIHVIHLGALNLAANTTASLANPVNASDRTLLDAGSISVATGARFDQASNDIELTSMNLADAQLLLQSGYSAGKWTGNGTDSSKAASNSTHLTALGLIRNNQSGNSLFSGTKFFDGNSPGAGDLLVKYTYYGDANLDGKVDGSDYTRIDAAYLNHSLTGWFNGDFNYDGTVNGSDYTLIDNAFNRQGAVLAAAIEAQPTIAVADDSFSDELRKRCRTMGVVQLHRPEDFI